MTTQEVESQWYVALYEEDCVQVMQLLKDHPVLLKVGWRSQRSRQVEGRWPNHFSAPSKSRWKGRTALHVGARRGCVQLVKQVLKLCNLKHVVIIYEKLEGETTEATLDRKDKAQVQKALNNFKGNVPLRHFRTLQNENTETQKLEERVTRPSWTTSPSPVIQYGAPVADDSPAQSNFAEIELAERSSSTAQSNLAERNSNTAGPSSVDNAPVALEGERLTDLAQSTVGLWHRQVENRKWLARRAFTRWKQQRTGGEVGNPQDSAGDCQFGKDPDGGFGKTAGGPLERLLASKDVEYGLDALAMAAVHGNHNITDLLCYAILECETPPYKVDKKVISPRALDPDDDKLRAELRQETRAVIVRFRDDPTFEEYSKHRDFNFLPREEYIFHFLYTARFYNRAQHDQGVSFPAALWASARWYSQSLWEFLLNLEDGQGRTLLHVAVDEQTSLDLLADLQMRIHVKNRDIVSSAMHSRDGAGRTAWHRAVASGEQDVLHQLLWFADREGKNSGEGFIGRLDSKPSSLLVNADSISERNGFQGHRTWKHRINIYGHYEDADSMSEKNGFQRHRTWKLKDNIYGQYEETIVQSTPLHSAIILGNTPYLEDLCNQNAPELYSNNQPFSWVLNGLDEGRDVKIELDTMELATLMGHRCVVRVLLENGYHRTPKKFTKENQGEFSIWCHPWPALHLASSFGNYELLKMFLDDTLCDPFIEDYEGNTALHHALKVTKLEFDTHLLDYVSCKHILEARKVNEEVSLHPVHTDSERQSCVSLLIQSGCDIFKANNRSQVPYPRGNLGTSSKFLPWWNEKQTKEFGMIQNSLTIAANAISVTAALVATTSFIGPLQPPLSYGGDPNQVQTNNRWVRVFIFCDTVSFYLAVTAITLSLIPCLPMPQQAMMDELRRTRRMVTLAVVILFPSLICVLVAFGTSSIAVVSYGTLSIGQILITVATTLCAPFFLGGFFLFLIRLLGISFPGNSHIRYIYNATSF